MIDKAREVLANTKDNEYPAFKALIDLKEAGIREIIVTDKGIGMNIEDAPLAFQRQATRKFIYPTCQSDT